MGEDRLLLDSRPLFTGKSGIGSANESENTVQPKLGRIPVFVIGVILYSFGCCLVCYEPKRLKQLGIVSDEGLLVISFICLLGGLFLGLVVVPFWL
jgi:hypothetical protein